MTIPLSSLHDVAQMIDHEILRPNITKDEIVKELEVAKKYNVHSVTVPPSYVPFAKSHLEDTNIKVGTVIGFPYGNQTHMSKSFESVESHYNGADELEIVINYGRVLSGEISFAISEVVEIISALNEANPDKIKFILETDYLSEAAISDVSTQLSELHVNFIQTSTGVLKPNNDTIKGATVDNVTLIKDSLMKDSLTQIKASSGVDTLDTLLALQQAGATRFGTSNTESILETLKSRLS